MNQTYATSVPHEDEDMLNVELWMANATKAR
jgi:hypothetical protein